ncbi:30S ribosomal protein S19e [Sulfodiicoccus acidiphilus]|uniref:Small ribosomal subunit protein eS19 n=1 Tax=Sulfodiicoccus acidiphilus TaxID=1670455 RepID=A0A348B2Z6_9CREN|nr:30S ribosomal protein S19e [Sulfodiicoccus acidiphilus]BBD72548.1 30S ribosomal protein S19e [Sulfodiicoccus acidiphilus]GGT93747.1 30S ribosomal protein S19e [Sulfodiicoccus acidiphilus]
MITATMVPADALIRRLSSYIKENFKEVSPPEWALVAKTGPMKERVPDEPTEWWYIRAASIMRKIYIEGKIGTSSLRTIYGGAARRGSAPNRFTKAPGHANRLIMRQLEKAGLLHRVKGGRILSGKGRSLMDRMSMEVFKEVSEINPELKKYLGK